MTIPEFKGNHIRACCPDCGGSVSSFDYKDPNNREYGYTVVEGQHPFKGAQFARIVYRMVACSGCGRGGLAKLHVAQQQGENAGILEWFFPATIQRAIVPRDVPKEIDAELREAELCASVGAWRAGSALLRSTLEKTLKVNGYTKGNDPTLRDLQKRIDAAATDGVITDARRRKAHDDIRTLGNDVLHDDWREVTPEEFATAHHYTQRILEDFYDDRPSVESILLAKGKLTPKAPASPGPTTP